MVAIKDVRAANALLDEATAPQVAVFVGGTAGIGRLTIQALVELGTAVQIFVVGRPSAAARTQAWFDELRAVNARAELVWVEGDITLLADIRRVCGVIREQVTAAGPGQIDLLFLSAGYAPFGPRQYTSEGHALVQVLEFYGRVLCTQLLLPLLEADRAPAGRPRPGRVVSILSGGMERACSVQADDVALRGRPGEYSGFEQQTHYGSCGTLALATLAAAHPRVTFVHAWPGLVQTGNARRSFDQGTWFGWLMTALLTRVMPVLMWRMVLSDDEAAARNLFLSTSALYGGGGDGGVPWTGEPGINTDGVSGKGGLFLVNYINECTPNRAVVKVLRERAEAKVWAHTEAVLKPYLG